MTTEGRTDGMARRTSRHAAAALLVAVAALAACGGRAHRAAPRPTLPRAVAQELVVKSDDVARKLDAGDGCGALGAAQALQQETIAAINARQVPSALQEVLLGAANGLVQRIQCTPPPTPGPGAGTQGHKGSGHGNGGEGD